MATVGNTNTPNGSYNSYGINIKNMLAIQVTMPSPGGTITSVSAYFAGKSGGGNITGRVLVWDTSGNILAQSGDLTVAAGTGGISGQAFQTGTVGGSSGLFVASGTSIRIGLWVHSNQSWEWTENAGGTEYQALDSSNTTPVSPASFSSFTGTPSIYATYTPAGGYVRRSGVWTAGSVSVRRSGAWVQASVFVRRSGAWVAAN